MMYTNQRKKQHGVVLVFSLMILLVLTMLGISAMKNSSLQGKIVNNKRNYDLAFQASDSALINAETWLLCQSSQADSSADGSTNVWAENVLANLEAQPDSWWKTSATVFGTDVDFTDIQTLAGVEAEPRYVIEQINNGMTEFGGCVPENLNMDGSSPRTRCLYRITSRGTGMNAFTQVTLRSHFALLYPRKQCKEAG